MKILHYSLSGRGKIAELLWLLISLLIGNIPELVRVYLLSCFEQIVVSWTLNLTSMDCEFKVSLNLFLGTCINRDDYTRTTADTK